MPHFFAIHPDNPQSRLLRQAAGLIAEGGIVVYPTDSGYALACALGNHKALQRIRALRQLNEQHNMTLMCANLTGIGKFARFTTPVFRLLKAFTPGSYTFILQASPEVPKLMLHPKRRTLGLRVPNHVIALALLEAMDAPLMSTTLILPGADRALSEPDAIRDLLGSQVDLIIDGGNASYEPTTVVDLTGSIPVIIRQGCGDPGPFLL